MRDNDRADDGRAEPHAAAPADAVRAQPPERLEEGRHHLGGHLRVFLCSLAGTVTGPGRGAVSGPGGARVSWWAVGWLLPPALFLQPVRSTLGYGQVNVLLMALVALDCLSAGVRWPRGALVGIAAAVKLTPGAFALYFLLRRDYRAAATAAAAFAVSTGAGFLLAPGDSARYWTAVVIQTGRPGSPVYAANQSIQGVLARAGLDPHTAAGGALWLALSALVLALACRGMRRALARSADAWALSLNAFAALLISPISWSHHWVWGETAVLTLAVLGSGSGRRAWLAAAGCGLAVFAAAPQWWFPSGAQRELGWAARQQVLGSSYVIVAGAALLLSARSPRGCDRLTRDISWSRNRSGRREQLRPRRALRQATPDQAAPVSNTGL